MKKAEELASESFTSAEEQKKHSLNLRRLAGGIKSAVERRNYTGLTDKEVKTLRDAAEVLRSLATQHSKAGELKKAEVNAREKAEKLIKNEMKNNFISLSTIPDQIAFIAAETGYLLRGGQIKTKSDLQFHFQECINSLSYRLSAHFATKTPQAAVAEAWEKFENGKAPLKEKYAAIIGMLLMAEEQNKLHA